MSVKTISNPTGAFGDTNDTQYYQPAEFEAGGNIGTSTGRPVVFFDAATSTVKEAATDTTGGLCIGIAMEPTTIGKTALVAVGGVVEGVRAQGAITAGATVIRSSSTAGAVAAGSTAGSVIGVALAAAANDLVDLYIYKA